MPQAILNNLSRLVSASIVPPTAVTVLGACAIKTAYHSTNWASESGQLHLISYLFQDIRLLLHLIMDLAHLVLDSRKKDSQIDGRLPSFHLFLRRR